MIVTKEEIKEIARILYSDPEIEQLRGEPWAPHFKLAMEKAGILEAWRLFNEAAKGLYKATMERKGCWFETLKINDILFYLETWRDWDSNLERLEDLIRLRVSLLERMSKREFYVENVKILPIITKGLIGFMFLDYIEYIIISNDNGERYKIMEGVVVPL